MSLDRTVFDEGMRLLADCFGCDLASTDVERYYSVLNDLTAPEYRAAVTYALFCEPALPAPVTLRINADVMIVPAELFPRRAKDPETFTAFGHGIVYMGAIHRWVTGVHYWLFCMGQSEYLCVEEPHFEPYPARGGIAELATWKRLTIVTSGGERSATRDELSRWGVWLRSLVWQYLRGDRLLGAGY